MPLHFPCNERQTRQANKAQVDHGREACERFFALRFRTPDVSVGEINF